MHISCLASLAQPMFARFIYVIRVSYSFFMIFYVQDRIVSKDRVCASQAFSFLSDCACRTSRTVLMEVAVTVIFLYSMF